MENERYGKYCKLCCSYFRNGDCFVDEDRAGVVPCEVLDWDVLEQMVTENYTIKTGDVRREWDNPDGEMLAWLDTHMVGTKFLEWEIGDTEMVYSYVLDDGRKVWETLDLNRLGTILVAIEEPDNA